jgi:hypothetical protein
MIKEYRLTIQAAGHSAEEAIESAVRMLNEGANFDNVTYLYDVPKPERRDSQDSEQL